MLRELRQRARAQGRASWQLCTTPRFMPFGVPLHILFVLELIYLFCPKTPAVLAVFYGLSYVAFAFMVYGLVRVLVLREQY